MPSSNSDRRVQFLQVTNTSSNSAERESLIRDGFFRRGEDQSLIHTRKVTFVFQKVCVGGVVAVIISKSQQRKLIISAIPKYAD